MSNRATYGDARPSAPQRRALRAALLRRDGDGHLAPCALMGLSPRCLLLVGWHTAQIDRRTPGKNGGRYDLANTQLACRHCNRARGALTLEQVNDILSARLNRATTPPPTTAMVRIGSAY